MILLLILWRKVVLPAVLALVLATAITVAWKSCNWWRPPVAKVVHIDRVEPYRPDRVYDIPQATTWRETGEVAGVPTVEPADKKTRDLVERVFGVKAEEQEFFWVGEVGPLRHGADIAVSRPKPEVPAIPVPEGGVDLDGLPRATAQQTPRPLELILRPRPAPWLDLRSVHRLEVAYDWTPELGLERQWHVEYRPWEMWIRGRMFLTVETGATQRAGETSFHVAAVGGACLGKDC